MKLAHYVFLALLVVPFVLPKLAVWLIGAMVVGTVFLLIVSGPVAVANLFLPKPPKS